MVSATHARVVTAARRKNEGARVRSGGALWRCGTLNTHCTHARQKEARALMLFLPVRDTAKRQTWAKRRVAHRGAHVVVLRCRSAPMRSVRSPFVVTTTRNASVWRCVFQARPVALAVLRPTRVAAEQGPFALGTVRTVRAWRAVAARGRVTRRVASGKAGPGLGGCTEHAQRSLVMLAALVCAGRRAGPLWRRVFLPCALLARDLKLEWPLRGAVAPVWPGYLRCRLWHGVALWIAQQKAVACSFCLCCQA